jgi:hypothetical protein
VFQEIRETRFAELLMLQAFSLVGATGFEPMTSRPSGLKAPRRLDLSSSELPGALIVPRLSFIVGRR